MGVCVGIGPFYVRLRVRQAGLSRLLTAMWQDYPVKPQCHLVDFHVQISSSRWLRRYLRPQVRFRIDSREPMPPHPAYQHLPFLEWGINWCIVQRAHHFLKLHAATLERGGNGILLPATPGSGKSTLAAALGYSGWRLLGDEFGLIRPSDGQLQPMPRLVALKNKSIDVIRAFSPHAYLGPSFVGTRKGTIAHARPTTDSIRRMQETATPRWLVFPRWVSGASLCLEPLAKADAFLMVAMNAFNYEILGQTAFDLVGQIVEACDCYTLVYSDLTEAMEALDDLAKSANA
ncbi:HprK-related kinase A [Lamprobacter modestohalophilus]|uniref:HprK-related kinase A n=1 Tax=Lamprobacter modestohalophilus TaxID=1064514 RepID=UPI002ADECF76|nr:HprK-related kinase A [Lamprobacter modestohalophilus]MEA1050953.1 HprK-related kinase A [Lamprobacter modestohalophilus]